MFLVWLLQTHTDKSGPKQTGQALDPSKFREHNSKSTPGDIRSNENCRLPQSRFSSEPWGALDAQAPEKHSLEEPCRKGLSLLFFQSNLSGRSPPDCSPEAHFWLPLSFRNSHTRHHARPWECKLLLLHNFSFREGDRYK